MVSSSVESNGVWAMLNLKFLKGENMEKIIYFDFETFFFQHCLGWCSSPLNNSGFKCQFMMCTWTENIRCRLLLLQGGGDSGCYICSVFWLSTLNPATTSTLFSSFFFPPGPEILVLILKGEDNILTWLGVIL